MLSINNKKNCLNLNLSLLRQDNTCELSGQTCASVTTMCTTLSVQRTFNHFFLYLTSVIGLEQDRVIQKSGTESENVLGDNKIGFA